MKRALPLLLTASMLTGCASIFSGTSQDIGIRTTPGARYTITNSYGNQVASGTSEGTANLQRGVGYFSPHAYKIKVSKEGYQSRNMDIEPGMNPWYFANILLGGVVGMLIVDPLTGAMYKLHPSTVDIPLEPAPQGSTAAETSTGSAAKLAQQPVSRFDYAAQQVAKQAGCKLTDSAEVINHQTTETLIFACADGQKQTVTCSNATGCK